MPEKKRPEKRGDIQTEEAQENRGQTEQRIQELEQQEATKGNQKNQQDSSKTGANNKGMK